MSDQLAVPYGASLDLGDCSERSISARTLSVVSACLLPEALCSCALLSAPSSLLRPHAPMSQPPTSFPGTLVMSSASRTRHLPRFNHTPFEGRRHPYAGRPIACMCPASSATALAIVCLRKTWPLRPHGGAEHSVAGALSGSAVSALQCSRYVAAPFVASLLGHQPRRSRAGLPRPVHPGFRFASHLLEAPDNATGASRATPRVGLSPTGWVMLRAAMYPSRMSTR